MVRNLIIISFITDAESDISNLLRKIEDFSFNQPKSKDLICSFLMGNLILYFQSESHPYKKHKSPCSVPCMLCCHCPSCRLHSHHSALEGEEDSDSNK